MLDIAIIGAGIGGLMTALRLHEKGFTPRVYESAAELRPLGVGIVSQPYGTREITEVGLLDELNARSVVQWSLQWHRQSIFLRCHWHRNTSAMQFVR